jgi:hypothetical protein
MDTTQNTADQTNITVPLPEGFDTAEALYLDTHASVGLILADFSLGFITAEQALENIADARKVTSAYVTALYEADQL